MIIQQNKTHMKLQVVKYTALSMMLYEANFVFVDGKTIKDKYDESELDKWEYPANFDYYEVVYWNENNRILMLKTKSHKQRVSETTQKMVDILRECKDSLVGFKARDFGHGDVISMPHVPIVYSPPLIQYPPNPNSIYIESSDSGAPFVDDDTLKERLMNNDDAVNGTVKVNCPECGHDYTYEVGYGFRECFKCLNTWKNE